MASISSSSTAVSNWQTFLVNQGLLPPNGVDGKFGKDTLAATKAYQLKKGLSQNGVADTATMQAAVADGFVAPVHSQMIPPGNIDVVFDISHHNKYENGRLDFGLAHSVGMLGVIHKSSEGISMVDEEYAGRKQQALASGLLWGAYHFGFPADGTQQADHFLAVIGQQGDVLPALDLEQRTSPHDPTVLLPSMSLKDAVAFILRIKEKTGKYPGMYGGPMLKQYMKYGPADQTGVLSECWLWLAQYGVHPVLPTGWDQWTFWQYSDGTVPQMTAPPPIPGIGAADRDFFNGSEDALRQFWAENSV